MDLSVSVTNGSELITDMFDFATKAHSTVDDPSRETKRITEMYGIKSQPEIRPPLLPQLTKTGNKNESPLTQRKSRRYSRLEADYIISREKGESVGIDTDSHGDDERSVSNQERLSCTMQGSYQLVLSLRATDLRIKKVTVHQSTNHGRVIATVSIKVTTDRYIVPAGYIVPTGLKDLSRAETYKWYQSQKRVSVEE
ncbi:hypothetical protein Tco_0478775 [Tanacetum coccineum]